MIESRRQFLGMAAVAASAVPLLPACRARRPPVSLGVAPSLALEDDRFLDELSRVSAAYFVDAAHPVTGYVLDRRRSSLQPDPRRAASIAATGFGLGALVLADARGWAPHDLLRGQVVRTLRHLQQHLGHVHGFFYHFHDWETGERIWKCELSSIDTAILLCGVLACRAHFHDSEVFRMASDIYERVEWPWMLNGASTFSMGWTPEAGFLERSWDQYSELMMLYLLALGSPTHPVPALTWGAWTRPWREFYGEGFVWSPAPLFVHQFSHAWFDFRGLDDHGTDWVANSVAATRAHRAWSLDRRSRFPAWSEDLWGVTSSDSPTGYVAWGGPPDSGPLDGTIVPSAAAGSLPFLPDECLRTLQYQRWRFGDQIWRRFGFVDAFNPQTGWVDPDVIGISLGITVLMAENLRTGLIWRTFSGDSAVRRGLRRAGFKSTRTAAPARGVG